MTWMVLGGCEPMGSTHVYHEDPVAPEPVGRLEISTDALDFGDASVGAASPSVRRVTVSNTGDGPLTVLGLDEVVGDSDAFSVSGAEAVMDLGPGERVELEVLFVPPTYGDYQGVLLADGSHRIDLWGHGSAPLMSISTDAVDFPEIPIGCDAQAGLSIRNEGDDLLLLEELLISSGSTDIFLLGDAEAILDPGEELDLDLVFAPSTSGEHTSVLSVHSNDPAEPVASVPLTGAATQLGIAEEQFEYLPRASADVLFMVDSTRSVFSRLFDAAANAELYFDSLDELGVDWRYTVSTAELDCYSTTEPWIDAKADATDAAGELVAAFGVHGEGDSQLLERTANLLERTDPGDCLAGFLRPDSQLHVILITDRQESSPESVAHYLSVYESQISKNVSTSTLTVSAVVGDGERCPEAAAALDAAELTDGVLSDLCQASWRNIYPRLAQASAATNRTTYIHHLVDEPVSSTIEVATEGGRTLHAWDYDSASNSILISGADNDVAVGEAITVRYLPATECP